MNAQTSEAPPPPERAPRAAVIVHPLRVNPEQFRTELQRVERAHGWRESLWFETSPEEPAAQLARRALEEDVQLIVAAGGDGTVRDAASALLGSDVPLGIVPAGTGNLLARNLGIDTVLLRAQLETAFSGPARRIDMARATVQQQDGTRHKHVFAVLGGIGLDAGMIANTDPEMKRRVGWLAYIGGIARTVIGESNFHARVRIDEGHPFGTRAHSLMIGNCGQLPGGMLLLPDAKIDDGLLDLVIMRPSGLLGWLQIWWSLAIQSGVLRHSEFGRSLIEQGQRRVRALRYQRGRRIDFRVHGAPRHFQVDGEALGEIVAARIEVLPGTLLVNAPAGTTLASRIQGIGQGVAASIDDAKREAKEARDARGTERDAERSEGQAETDGARG